MKKILSWFVWLMLISLSFSAYYHPNPEISRYLEDVTNKFVEITSYANTNPDNIPTNLFADLANDFSVLKNKLPQDNPNFKVIYENCYLASKDLANWFSRLKFDTFNSQCFWPWKQITREISTNYTVKAKIKAYPNSWNAPLTVTFDGRWSYDPSADTIPTNNYFWYYKDSNWVERLMGQWPVIKYTFTQPNNYVVHLTVRSANKETKWILDWEATTTISVAPPIAKIVMYINGQKATTDSYVKVSTAEAKAGILFDASWTTPNGWTKIVSSTWIIKHDNRTIFQKTIPDYPGSVRVKLPGKWFYFVTLIIKDNTWKTVKKTFKVIVSNPVAVIKVKPTEWDTSTTFVIDGSASYSVSWRITSYKWTIVWPNWNILDQFQWKKFFKYKFSVPWNYSIKLEVSDSLWNKNDATYKLFVDSTPPTASFVYRPYDNWEKPSTYIFDASYSYDPDIKVGDKLSYYWKFSNSKEVKIQEINNWEKIIAQFNKKWVYNVTLIVRDKYWKSSSVTKQIKILSTLRPEVFINPNYTILGNPIQITVKTNKPVAYFEYYFGDGKYMKTQSHMVSHTYTKAWIFPLKVVAYSVDGDSNSITKLVFVWQRWYPLAIYKIIKKNKVISPNTYCRIKDSCTSSGCKFAPAYKVPRLQDITIDARDSINSQWTHDMLKIYFEKSDDGEYINGPTLITNFDELWCKKITLYVKDLTNNKVDKKDIYFKVVDALPVLKDLKMYFPQYGGAQNGVFQPNVGNSALPKNIFAPGFDPLLVKLKVIGAYDPDSPMLSYFRWYYYRKGDRNNLIDVKITPYNIPEVVFSLPRIPWTYIFGVDVCDVDGKCTNSEKYLHLKPIVNIPPSTKNPNIPQINSVRIDYDWIKWVGEVNVGDKVTIHVNATVLSSNPDFKINRIFKYDFNNDGKYDLITKKDTVEHIYTKPWKYRVKVKCIYRGYGGIGYSPVLIVKKGLKPLVDINYKWKDLIFNDMSMWNIKERYLCFDLTKCRKNPNYLFKDITYGHVYYPTTGIKLLFFKYKDSYGNEKTVGKKILITWKPLPPYLLTLPKAIESNSGYILTVAWMYKNSFILFYRSKNKDCYIDKNISIDTDKDGNTSNDKDLSCNQVYKLTYDSTPEVVLLIHDGNQTKKLFVKFANVDFKIPSKFKTQYKQLQQLIYKYAGSSNQKIQFLVKLLSDLLNNLDDAIDRDSIILQLSDFINQNKDLISQEDENTIKSIISSLSDIATNPALNKDATVYQSVKQDLLILLSNDADKLNNLFAQLEQTTLKTKRKEILQKILNIGVSEEKNWTIDAGTLQMVKSDVCSLLKYYDIPSEACGTALPKKWTVSTTSLGSKILHTVLIILWIFALIFVVLIVIFVIKAKKRREEIDDE